MRLVVAPDAYAGTLGAGEAAHALATGWASARPADRIRSVPMSDGGPGLVEVLQPALPRARVLPIPVEDAVGRTAPAALLLDGTSGYVESAAACGLDRLSAAERDPLSTSTYGVGQLVRAALDAGARRIVVGLGGSATNDGGAGLLAALGVTGLDRDGRPLPRGGAALARLDRLVGRPDPRLSGVELVAASDVDAPLLGPYGASRVFGPQKGASASDVELLDAALARWADVLEPALGLAVRDRPGAGAAGGLGAALLALGARREPGVALVGEVVGLAPAVAAADLVLTGEGCFDATSLTGKVVSGVAATAAAAGVPCVVLAGRVEVGARQAAGAGVTRAYAVVDAVGSEAALADPAATLAALAATVARGWGRT